MQPIDKISAICYTTNVEFYKFILNWFIGIFHIFMKFLKGNFEIFEKIVSKKIEPCPQCYA